MHETEEVEREVMAAGAGRTAAGVGVAGGTAMGATRSTTFLVTQKNPFEKISNPGTCISSFLVVAPDFCIKTTPMSEWVHAENA